MEAAIQIILNAGRTGVDLALYTLLPIMVVMLALMKLLDAWGVLAFIARLLSLILKPFVFRGWVYSPPSSCCWSASPHRSPLLH